MLILKILLKSQFKQITIKEKPNRVKRSRNKKGTFANKKIRLVHE
jgi:hypothetical protein